VPLPAIPIWTVEERYGDAALVKEAFHRADPPAQETGKLTASL